jgi:hypothetical protein
MEVVISSCDIIFKYIWEQIVVSYICVEDTFL